MTLHFYKYHGTGNDFILIDNRNKTVTLDREQVAHLCHRNFGIGADGLMLLENEKGYDFKMVYYNADGNESTMCGNGGRCITAFAKRLNIIENEAKFIAIDGKHQANIDNNMVSLQMQDVDKIEAFESHTEINTGSPHYITFVDNAQKVDVFAEGKNIRNKNKYQPNGINVNFVQKLDEGIWVRTYERGVENETLSCGTGVTAAAIAANNGATSNTKIYTLGGELNVSYTKELNNKITNIILTGPAEFIFEGDIKL